MSERVGARRSASERVGVRRSAFPDTRCWAEAAEKGRRARKIKGLSRIDNKKFNQRMTSELKTSAWSWTFAMTFIVSQARRLSRTVCHVQAHCITMHHVA